MCAVYTLRHVPLRGAHHSIVAQDNVSRKTLSSGTWDLVNSEILARNEEKHKIPEIPRSVDLRPIFPGSLELGGATHQKHRTFQRFGELKSWERNAHKNHVNSRDPRIRRFPTNPRSRHPGGLVGNLWISGSPESLGFLNNNSRDFTKEFNKNAREFQRSRNLGFPSSTLPLTTTRGGGGIRHPGGGSGIPVFVCASLILTNTHFA